jgi:hypothetical protein
MQAVQPPYMFREIKDAKTGRFWHYQVLSALGSLFMPLHKHGIWTEHLDKIINVPRVAIASLLRHSSVQFSRDLHLDHSFKVLSLFFFVHFSEIWVSHLSLLQKSNAFTNSLVDYKSVADGTGHFSNSCWIFATQRCPMHSGHFPL